MQIESPKSSRNFRKPTGKYHGILHVVKQRTKALKELQVPRIPTGIQHPKHKEGNEKMNKRKLQILRCNSLRFLWY